MFVMPMMHVKFKAKRGFYNLLYPNYLSVFYISQALEMKSDVFSDKFLQAMENDYKETVLPHLESHSHLLVYPSIPDITDHEVEMVAFIYTD